MLSDDLARLLMGFIDDLTDRLIDFKGNLSREVPLSIRVVTAKEDRTGVFLVLDRAKIGHTELGDHETSEPGRFFNIVLCSGRDIIEEDFFGGASA
ncbi:MAG: hypothetical protein BWY98_00163 [Tenericutes bacterium ADurb.BinA155]|nr:MAG: hypothetical protein BWY98_00163 [Tenericutes bacterium ADurb.BinA155]